MKFSMQDVRKDHIDMKQCTLCIV
uniref:Uncharacterized protein n=1 Tax=Anguilla anguilla TaxID=7936 RepID=A0A0E9VZV7_ANGAN